MLIPWDANPSFEEELYSRSYFVDMIDLTIISSIKDIKIIKIENKCKVFFLTASVKARFMRIRVVEWTTNRDVLFACSLAVSFN